MTQTLSPRAQFDVAVIGGGAAGLMCAIEAGKRGRSVIVLEHAARVCKKVVISGGGRCNFTNLHCSPEVFLSRNPRFCVSALTRYTQHDFIALVEKHSIPYHEKKLGQLFCDNTSKDIVDMLLAECEQARVTVRAQCAVRSVQRDGRYRLDTTIGPLTCEALVIATGGLSVPQMGATGFAYDLARQFGLAVTETRAALVPFTFTGEMLDLCRTLSGVSVPCAASCNGASFTENLLFTHRGMSGPAILQLSSSWRDGMAVTIDLLPGVDALAYLEGQKSLRPKAELPSVLAERLPRRFAQLLCERYLTTKPMTHLTRREMDSAARLLKQWTFTPDGTEGYRTAEVTLGGVDTTGLSSKSMEAVEVPGLFFIGECVDVTGPLGGYNLQWAWSSGYCAGQSV